MEKKEPKYELVFRTVNKKKQQREFLKKRKEHIANGTWEGYLTRKERANLINSNSSDNS